MVSIIETLIAKFASGISNSLHLGRADSQFAVERLCWFILKSHMPYAIILV